jgi:hypothetical protein
MPTAPVFVSASARWIWPKRAVSGISQADPRGLLLFDGPKPGKKGYV